MNVKLVVFDMAGTTVQDDDVILTHLRGALRRAGVPVGREEINAVMGLPKPAAIRRLLAEKNRLDGLADEQVSRIHDDFLSGVVDHYRTDPGVAEVPGTTETLRALHAGGVRVALDTGFSRQIVDVILERLPWQRAGLLDVTIASDEVPRGRPYPDMILRAMAATGVTDVRAVAKVGDTPSDLVQGSAAGCGWVVGVASGSHTHAELLRCPHTHLIESVADLPEVLELCTASGRR